MMREKLLVAVASALVAAGGTKLAYNEVMNADPSGLYDMVRESTLNQNQKDFLTDVLVAASLGSEDAQIRDKVVRSIQRQINLARHQLAAIRPRMDQYPDLEPALRRLERSLSGLVAAQATVVPLLNREDVPQEELNAEFARIVALLKDPPEFVEIPAPVGPLNTAEEDLIDLDEEREEVRRSFWWGIAKKVGTVTVAVLGAGVTLLTGISLLMDLRKKRRAVREERKPMIILPGA